jgi:hypothetical protein
VAPDVYHQISSPGEEKHRLEKLVIGTVKKIIAIVFMS